MIMVALFLPNIQGVALTTVEPTITATSGSASDIQTAVDWIVSQGSVGTVFVPAGTWDFTPVNQWYELAEGYGMVMVPEGVNIIGATPLVDADGMVTEWATTLRCSWLIGGVSGLQGSSWFFFSGTGDSSKTTQFANIKIVGERTFDPSINYLASRAIIFNEVRNYHVDHCGFFDLSGGGIWAGWYAPDNSGASMHCNGVIDHNTFINQAPAVPHPFGTDGIVGYGVMLGRTHAEYWDNEVTNVLGHFTSYTSVIEDNYFSKWRHCVSSNDGAHYVFRYNTVESSFGFGDVDAHGTYDAVGTRAIEVYGNEFLDCQSGYNYEAVRQRGGAAIVTDNFNDGSYATVVGISYDLISPTKCLVSDTYIWGNTQNWNIGVTYTDGIEYFTRSPNLIDDGWLWTPYDYPHPFVSDLPANDDDGNTLPPDDNNDDLPDDSNIPPVENSNIVYSQLFIGGVGLALIFMGKKHD